MGLESKAIIYGGAIVIGVGFYLVKNYMTSKKNKKADNLLDSGDPASAIAEYKTVLLNKLELGKSSLNDDNPHILLDDAKNEGLEIMTKLEAAYAQANVVFNPEKYHQFISQLEELIENKENFGITRKMKSHAKVEFNEIREGFKKYISVEMPTP